MNKERNFNYISCFSFLWRYAKSFWNNFLMFYLGCLLDYILFIVIPIISGIMIDQIVYYQNTSVFIRLGLVQLSFVAFYSYNYFVTYKQHSYLTAHFIYKFKSESFKHLLKCSPKYLSYTSSGELITIIDKYTNEGLNFFIKNFIHHINNICNVVFCVIYILIINWKLGLIVLTIVPISVFISQYFGEKIRSYATEKQQRQAKYNGKVMELLGAIREIKLLAAQKKVLSDFSNDNKSLIQLDFRSSFTQLNGQNILKGSQLILQLLLFLALAYFAFINEVTIGSALVILAYYSDVRLCISAIVNSHFDAKTRIEYIKSIYDFMNQSEEEDLYNGEQLTLTDGIVEYNNVFFQYDEKPLLKNITFRIMPGKKVALVGKSGCGKSTLVYMLLRFYDPQIGDIIIDKTPIKEISLYSLRRNIGIVLQDNFLFNATIRDNISFGMSNISDEEILLACERAGIKEFVMSLPEKLDTAIGGDGRGISGGQRQRIAIARIYLQNPKIIIFDESTSALDAETEKEIFDAWDEVLQGKTTIIIAHRLNSILQCDEAIVIKDGEVFETGVPQELLLQSTYFKQIFAKEAEQC